MDLLTSTLGMIEDMASQRGLYGVITKRDLQKSPEDLAGLFTTQNGGECDDEFVTAVVELLDIVYAGV